MLLNLSKIAVGFGEETLFSSVSFTVSEKEHIALVGPNGAGKTTLLRVILGEIAPEEGQVQRAKDLSIGYLPQHPQFESHTTVYEELFQTRSDLLEIEKRLKELEEKLSVTDPSKAEDLLKEHEALTTRYEREGGYAYRSEVTGILKGLGFREAAAYEPVASLSGGEKTRVFLGKLLLTRPNLLILDEPTNHLDMAAIAWLENYLTGYESALILVAHDRYFLDKIAEKVVELDGGTARTYRGNYTQYAQKKAQLREEAMKAYLKQQAEINHQKEVIRKLRSFNREKSIKRAESRVKVLDKIVPLDKPQDEENIRFSFSLDQETGKDVLSLRDLGAAFPGAPLFSHADIEIYRGQKVAVIGSNGTGKSTLLKIITGRIAPTEGELVFGSHVEIGYYDQEQGFEDMNRTLFDEIQNAYPEMNNTQVRSLLAAFLFIGDDVFKEIGFLSGGERGRLSLAKLMAGRANLLLLDEPTNHLDIPSREVLEDALRAYPGTVLFVSHDRYLINRVATRVLALTEGTFLSCDGNYDDYLEQKDTLEAVYLSGGNQAEASGEAEKPEAVTAAKADWQEQKERAAKARKYEKDLSQTEGRIEELEKRKAEIHDLFTQEEIFTDHEKLRALQEELDGLEAEQNALYEKWEDLLSQNEITE